MIRRFAELCLVLCSLFGVLYGPAVVAKVIKAKVVTPDMIEKSEPVTTLLQSKPTAKTRDLKPTPPPLALCLPLDRITDVHDGDTCKAIVQIPITIRYEHCWAPELKEPMGPVSAKRAKEALGKAGRVYIDLSDVHNLADMLTFGRVVGEVWIDGETESESAKQVRLKLAATKKNGVLGE